MNASSGKSRGHYGPSLISLLLDALEIDVTWAWWHKLLISALGRQKHEDLSSGEVWPTQQVPYLHRETLP